VRMRADLQSSPLVAGVDVELVDVAV